MQSQIRGKTSHPSSVKSGKRRARQEIQEKEKQRAGERVYESREIIHAEFWWKPLWYSKSYSGNQFEILEKGWMVCQGSTRIGMCREIHFENVRNTVFTK